MGGAYKTKWNNNNPKKKKKRQETGAEDAEVKTHQWLQELLSSEDGLGEEKKG